MRPIEVLSLGRKTLVQGENSVNIDFPKGLPVLHYDLFFTIPLTISGSPSGCGALTYPLYELISKVQLTTDVDGDVICLPGKSLFFLSSILEGTLLNFDNDSYAPSTGHAYVLTGHLRMPFFDPRLQNPFIHLLDTKRYKSMQLNINIGAPVNSTDGAGTLPTFTYGTITVDIEACQMLDKSMQFKGVQKLLTEDSPKETGTETLLQIGRSTNKFIKRLYLFGAHTGASASRVFSGNGDNTLFDTISLESELRNHQQSRKAAMIRDVNKIDYDIETWLTGLHVIDFCKGGVLDNMLYTGDLSRLELKYVEDSGATSGSNYASVISESVNPV